MESLNLDVFNSLNIESQVTEVNRALEDGISLNQFGKNIGLDEGGIRKRFKRAGYVRGKEGKKLFEFGEGLSLELTPKQKPVKQIKKEEKQVQPYEVPVVINGAVEMGWVDIESFMERLGAVEAKLKAVRKELDAVKEKSALGNTEALTRKMEGFQEHIFEPKEFTTELKQISYRYNTEVLDKLDKLCKQNKLYSKTSILNTLLDEVIDQYLK